MRAEVEVYPLADGGVLLRFERPDPGRFGVSESRLEIEVDADGDATILATVAGENVTPISGAPDSLAKWFGLEIEDS
jgi:hypothetical protein